MLSFQLNQYPIEESSSTNKSSTHHNHQTSEQFSSHTHKHNHHKHHKHHLSKSRQTNYKKHSPFANSSINIAYTHTNHPHVHQPMQEHSPSESLEKQENRQINVSNRMTITKNRIDIQYDTMDPPKGTATVDNIKTPKGPKIKKRYRGKKRLNIRNISTIGATPKASSLKNHWGTDKLQNIQGPKGTNYNMLHQDPNYKKKHYYYHTVAKNYYSENPLTDPLRDESTKPKKIIASEFGCINELNNYYPFCSMQSNSCESCVSSPHCVQSFQLGKCLPGDSHGDTCRQFANNFASAKRQCTMQFMAVHNGDVNDVTQTVNKLGPGSELQQQELDQAGKTRVISGAFTNLSPDSYTTVEPAQVNNLSNGVDLNVAKKWKPTLSANQDVVSGKISNLSRDSQKLINPGIPSVFTTPSQEPIFVDLNRNFMFKQKKESKK